MSRCAHGDDSCGQGTAPRTGRGDSVAGTEPPRRPTPGRTLSGGNSSELRANTPGLLRVSERPGRKGGGRPRPFHAMLAQKEAEYSSRGRWQGGWRCSRHGQPAGTARPLPQTDRCLSGAVGCSPDTPSPQQGDVVQRLASSEEGGVGCRVPGTGVSSSRPRFNGERGGVRQAGVSKGRLRRPEPRL
jgi:hypothetical protein